MKEFKGQLEGFPEEVVEAMLNEQVAQGNKRDVSVFEECRHRDKNNGGFDFDRSRIIDGDGLVNHRFWASVIFRKDFDLFFKHFPKKSEYPKLMYVSDYPIQTNGMILLTEARIRVVFMEKNGKYIAWSNATSFEEAEKTTSTIIWNYAIDVKETQPEIKELTIDEIAEKFGVKAEQIKIKKSKK